MTDYPFIPYTSDFVSEEELRKRSSFFYSFMNLRRSVRDFSDLPVPREVMETIIQAASTAPSGAHKQPWTFCLVKDAEIKKQIRDAAEKEEYESYHGRMNEEWLNDLAPLGTDWRKPFLETAPWLIVVFRHVYELQNKSRRQNYYSHESAGIACGFLLAAIHYCGLATLTHTPSPMNFLSKILNRPENEKPYLLLPVGYAAENALVPDLKRKELEEIAVIY